MKTLDIQNTPPQSPANDIKQDNNNNHEDVSMNDSFCTQPIVNTSILNNPPLNPMERRSSSSILESSSKETFSSNRSISVDEANFVGSSLNNYSVEQLTSGFLTKKSKASKRGTLPKKATNELKAWLFQHLVVSCFLFY